MFGAGGYYVEKMQVCIVFHYTSDKMSRSPSFSILVQMTLAIFSQHKLRAEIRFILKIAQTVE